MSDYFETEGLNISQKEYENFLNNIKTNDFVLYKNNNSWIKTKIYKISKTLLYADNNKKYAKKTGIEKYGVKNIMPLIYEEELNEEAIDINTDEIIKYKNKVGKIVKSQQKENKFLPMDCNSDDEIEKIHNKKYVQALTLEEKVQYLKRTYLKKNIDKKVLDIYILTEEYIIFRIIDIESGVQFYNAYLNLEEISIRNSNILYSLDEALLSLLANKNNFINAEYLIAHGKKMLYINIEYPEIINNSFNETTNINILYIPEGYRIFSRYGKHVVFYNNESKDFDSLDETILYTICLRCNETEAFKYLKKLFF